MESRKNYKIPVCAKRLQELRRNINLSQIDLAKRIGATQGQVTNWERGKNKIPNWVFAVVTREFDINMDWLRGENAPFKVERFEDLSRRYLNGTVRAIRIDRNQLQVLMPMPVFRKSIHDALANRSSTRRALEILMSQCAFDDELVWSLTETLESGMREIIRAGSPVL